MVKKNTVPDGWRGIIPVGRRIPRTRFIAFKVPLKGAISQRLTANQKFSPKDLIAKIKEQNEELGLIIDLTYTTRYYTEKDLPKSVQYQKLYTVGHEVPDDATILQFKRRVRKFLWENADNDKIIGVHCTGGINRTGYLICRYLIDVEEVDPETTIELFNAARGHKMDGAVYLADLRCGPMRSNLGIDVFDAEPEPEPEPEPERLEPYPSYSLRPHGPRPMLDDFPEPDSRHGPSYGALPLSARDFDVPPYNRWHDRPRPLPPPLPPPPPSLLYGEHRPLPRFDDYGPEEYIGRSRFNHFNEHRAIRSLEENSRLHSRYAPYSTRLPVPQDRYREDFERKPYSITGRRELEPQSSAPNTIFTRDYNHGQPPERGPSLSKLGGGFYDNFDSFRDYEWN
ncbi:RNA/RNP complex-1-interacting phosphatase-like [Pristis pectinata]|uniref:RNA/RNP complex-1-interacting phosphatase-like n=1 Tax=Pristis pectinata TaxID=685728 RepID=UPI00223E827F|nr:RNA/RNP complex-1-interacting phosphatase-like [Pristis pectinata]